MKGWELEMTKQQIAKLIIMGGLAMLSLLLMMMFGNDYAILVFISVIAIFSDYDSMNVVDLKEERQKLYCIADIILISSIICLNLLFLQLGLNQVVLYVSVSLVFAWISVMLQVKIINFSKILGIKPKELLAIIGIGILFEVYLTKFIFNNFVRLV